VGPQYESETNYLRQYMRLLFVSLGVLTLVTAAFVLHTVLHLAPSVVALVGGLLLLALSRLDAHEVAKDVEWPTLVFFAGLFIMVGALVNTGVIGQVSQAATDAVGGRLCPATMVLLWGSAFLSRSWTTFLTWQRCRPSSPIWWPDSPTVKAMCCGGRWRWGRDLGGNATAIGASANVVILGMAERAGKRISFWEFTKYGLIVTVITIALCVPYLWLRYFAFA